ncbi:DUF2489 domain-containing protein [Alcanivorax sediminis]|uniref:DUF2489 domain-containing protein n=1 Tax=Alcanivorax sediminis TaxID=2663008 RepID=A0A6N7LUD4_9GAMM|nr:DUF2489 domain-containing protein [Alcanivorax sediminis]MQX54079.1 DUF2489 domain-containing protein [Alcanivorax sediminis]
MSLVWQIILAALIGLVIGTVMGLLAWRLWLARKQREEAKRQQLAVLDSLGVLCMAMVQQQIELSEASIRISALLDTLPDTISPKVDLSDFHQFAETCRQFDRGDSRQALTPRVRHQQDSYRWQLEEDYKERLEACAQRLETVLPAWRAGLGVSSSLR